VYISAKNRKAVKHAELTRMTQGAHTG
jgi:hypothetical protein